jgi:hypothetical protein
MNIFKKLYRILAFWKNKKKEDVEIEVDDILSVNMNNITVCVRASIKTGKKIETKLHGTIQVIEMGDDYVLCKYYPYSKPTMEAYIVITNKEYNRIHNEQT